MEGYGISLGQFTTEYQAKLGIKNHKRRLAEVIRMNKYSIKPSAFKFKIVHEKSRFTQEYSPFSYYLYVYTPDQRYNWIFLR